MAKVERDEVKVEWSGAKVEVSQGNIERANLLEDLRGKVERNEVKVESSEAKVEASRENVERIT